MLPTATTLLYALLGGILPALFWLWFWLREDKRCPEPRGLIMLAFVVGMIAVPLVIPIEQWVASTFTGSFVLVVVLWAVAEEVLKFLAASVSVLWNKAVNEPVDMMIYMITVALGFAAFENTLFLLSPLGDGFVVESILTGNLRFMGAMLLHVLASATVGTLLAFSFFRKPARRKQALFIGLILASALHALFNFFILKSNGDTDLLLTFLAVWLGVILLILIFERVKRIRNPYTLFSTNRTQPTRYGKR